MQSKELKIPIALEQEFIALAGCVNAFEWRSKVLAHIQAVHFYDPKNREIFVAIEQLAKSDIEVALEKIIEILESKGINLERLFEINSYPFSYLDPQELIDCLMEAEKKRALQTACDALAFSIGTSTASFKDIFAKFDRKICEIANGSGASGAKTLNEILSTPDFMTDLREKKERCDKGLTVCEGIPTGYYDIDKMIGGLVPGHLMVVGGRPGSGKTTLTLNFIENLILRGNFTVLLFSLEMPAKEICTKMMMQFAELEFSKARSGKFTSEELDYMERICNSMRNKRLLIDDQGGLDIDQIKSRAKYTQRAHGLDLVCVDYLQMVKSPSKSKESRQLEIADVSRSLKELAKELNVPVIAAAQLNRDIEKRATRTPCLSDLRESGGIEADADEVLLIHRPSVYDKYEKPGIMEVHIEKNRFGPTGKVDLLFNGETSKIKNYAKV